MGHYSYAIKTFPTCLVVFPDFMSSTSFKYVAWVWSFKMECFLLVVCFIFVYWNDSDPPFSSSLLSKWYLVMPFGCATHDGIRHVACGISSACISWCHSYFFTFFLPFFFLSFFHLFIFLYLCKFCIKGLHVRVYVCVYAIIMDIISCPLPFLGEGSVETMGLARREKERLYVLTFCTLYI